MLKGINVGGQKQIRMESLRESYEGLGFSRVRSYVQSGNIIFESTDENPSILGKRIEAQIEQVYGYQISVFIRQAYEIQRILAGNPFINDGDADLSTLHVTFLYQSPPEAVSDKLTKPGNISDAFAIGESAIYLYCPNGYGKTRLTNSFFERRLGMPVTTRNWNTVNALYKIATTI
jgi:uncharacterized protein (DUF1697 family)